MKNTILQDAAKLTSTDRQKTYGHPRENFHSEAAAWSAYLWSRGLVERGTFLEPRDVAQLNILQKSIRQAHAPKRDNLTDIAGYARTEEMLGE